MFGTSVYSIVYYAIAAILVVLVTRHLIKLWTPMATSVKSAVDGNESNLKTTPVVKPLNKTIVIVAGLIIVLTLLWNIKQHFTATTTNYQSPAEINELKKAQDSQPPTKDEADKALQEQKQRSEVKPSEDAFKNFNESMKAEEVKIKERNK